MAEDPKEGDRLAELLKRVTDLEAAATQIDLADDTTGKLVSYTSGATANADDPVNHGLKRPVKGVIVTMQDMAGSIYRSPANPGDTDKIFMRCSVAGLTAQLYVF